MTDYDWQPPDLELMDPDEVARTLKIHKKTVYSLIQRGKLPGAVRIGRMWRVNKKELIAYCQKEKFK